MPDWLAKERGDVKCYNDCQNIIQDHNGYKKHRVTIGQHQREDDVRQDSREKLYRIPDAIVGYLTGVEASGVPRDAAAAAVREVVIKEHQHRPEVPFMIGMMENRGGGHQLLMTVDITVGDFRRTVRALVDTGAQVSIIKQSLIPEEIYKPAKKPLSLRTASGEHLQGGRRVANLEVLVAAESDQNCQVKTPWKAPITVHDGDIGADMIIGYPWLKRQRLDIQPWRNALQLHDPPRWVLRAQLLIKSNDMGHADEDMKAVQTITKTRGGEPQQKRRDAGSSTRTSLLEEERGDQCGGGHQHDETKEKEDVQFWVQKVQKMQLSLVPEIEAESGRCSQEKIEDEDTIE